MSKKDFVELQVKENKVVVFSKTYCPYCKKAKEALSSTGLKNYALVELDERDDGDELQDILKGITGGRSVGIISEVYFHFRGEETVVKIPTESGDLWRRKNVSVTKIDHNYSFQRRANTVKLSPRGCECTAYKRIVSFFTDS